MLLLSNATAKYAKVNLHNYFNLHICPSLRRRRRHVTSRHTFKLPIPAVDSQNVSNKSCLACAQSEKYSFWFTLRPLGSMRRGEAELHTLQYQARWNQATYIKTQFSVSSPLQCRSQAVVCVSTPRMYPRSGYFLVMNKLTSSLLLQFQMVLIVLILYIYIYIFH